MYVRMVSEATGGGHRYVLCCPNCGQNGTFETINNIQDLHVTGYWLSLRRCPNPSCRAGLFIIANDQQEILRSYPPTRIDFDANKIPPRILKTFTEAIACHAEKFYVASAILIRRTLEELCEDRKAEGGSLKDRIHALRSKIVVPDELFQAMDELRLLGNDAAHIEAKVYDTIGENEIELGIELTKEVLKAIYQLDDLISRLRALKKA